MLMNTVSFTFKGMKMAKSKGESLKVSFNGSLKLEFHGSKVTSDAGLLAYRELDEALGLFDAAPAIFQDWRTGRQIQHDIRSLLRQSVYMRMRSNQFSAAITDTKFLSERIQG